jgi:hypothetical protein
MAEGGGLLLKGELKGYILLGRVLDWIRSVSSLGQSPLLHVS